MSELEHADDSKEMLLGKLEEKEKLISDLYCRIDSLETLLSVYRMKESSERKPSREETSIVLSSTGRSQLEKEEFFDNQDEILKLLGGIPDDYHQNIAKIKALTKNLMKETSDLRAENIQLKANLDKMIIKRQKPDSENTQIISNLRAENTSLKEELNLIKTPQKKIQESPIPISSEFKQPTEDEFLDFDLQLAYTSSLSSERVDEQLKRFQKNLDSLAAMKNNMNMQLNYKVTHSSVTASVDNLDTASHCSNVLNFGLQSLIDNLRSSITVENPMTGSVIIHPGAKNYGSNLMLRIEEEDKKENDSGKESVMSRIKENNDEKVISGIETWKSEIFPQKTEEKDVSKKRSFEQRELDAADIVNVGEEEPPRRLRETTEKIQQEYQGDLSDLLKKNIEKLLGICKQNQALLAESCHSLELNFNEMTEKQKAYLNETVQNVLSDRTNKLIEESNEQTNKTSPSYKFFRKVIKEISSVFKKKNKQILEELSAQIKINESLRKQNKDAYELVGQTLEIITQDLVTLNAYAYQTEEALQKMETLENRVIVGEEEVSALKAENEKMFQENQRREKIIEEVTTSFESEVLDQANVNKSQEKTRYMNYKDNFDKLKIVAEKVLESFLNKEAGNDFGKKLAIKEYKNKIKELQQESKQVSAQSDMIKAENIKLKETVSNLEKKYLSANKSLDEFLVTFASFKNSSSSFLQNIGDL